MDAYSPRTLVKAFARTIQLDQIIQPVTLRGIYHDTNRRQYHGFYFDRLRDEDSGYRVTVKVPANIKRSLQTGQIYTFEGGLNFTTQREGALELVMIVSNYRGEARNPLRLQTVLAQKRSRSAETELEQQLQTGKPHIAIIEGMTSVARQDVLTALQDSASAYNLVHHPINITDYKQILSKLDQLDDSYYDAVAVVRGGGPGVEVFDDVEIAERIVTMQPLILTAIGHARDKTLVEQIADEPLATPTALGEFLRKLVAPVPVVETLSIQSERPDSAEKQPDWLNPALAIALVIAIIIIMFLLSQ